MNGQTRRFIRSHQRCIGTAPQHGVQGCSRLLLGREAFDPLALEAGLLDLGTDGILLRRAAQGVAHPGNLFDLAEQGDAAIEYGHGLIGVPVACVGRLGVSQQIPRSGDAVEPDRDRVLAGRGPRQAALAPEREALAQRVVELAVSTGASPGLVRIEAAESNGGRRVGQGTRWLDPCFGRLCLEVQRPQLGVVRENPGADRLEAVPWYGFGCGDRQRQRPQCGGEHEGKQVPERWPTADQQARVQASSLKPFEQGCHISVLVPTRRRSLRRGQEHMP